MKLKHIIIASIVFLTAMAFSYSVISVGATPGDRISPGVYVQGRELSGMGRSEAENELNALKREIAGMLLTLRYDSRTKSISPGQAGISLDVEAMLGPALEAGHQGNVINKMLQQKRIRQSGHEIPLIFKVEQEKLDSFFKEIAGEINVQPVNAELKINSDDTVSVLPGRGGMAVDSQKALADMQEAIISRRQGAVVELALVVTNPDRTTDEIREMGIDGLLSAYTTIFDEKLVERSYNVRVAAGALDGLFVAPGEILSFNKVVGPRSSEAGYKSAKIIVNNQFVDGLGGGVCQVSSTLYNVVLLAGLEVLERSNHSVAISYVPPGRDATVVYGALDLCFKNNTGKYIYIKALPGTGRLTFKIYGNTSYKKEISLKTSVLDVVDYITVSEPDPRLEKDRQEVKTEGIKGMRVTAQRIIWENGAPRIEPLPSSLYKPLNKVVLVGTGEVSKPGQGGQSAPAGDAKPIAEKPGGEAAATGPDPGKKPPVTEETDVPKAPEGGQGGGSGTIVPPAPPQQ